MRLFICLIIALFNTIAISVLGKICVVVNTDNNILRKRYVG
jgi:hypothetical protein